MTPKYSDLVELALPADVSLQELLVLAPKTWWENKNYLACAMALRKSPRINWEAYLRTYPDVKVANMDPCLHFLRHGIYEGRKLFSWSPLHQGNGENSPLISVIVNNYNNALYVPFCLQSIINQTLKDIEIIVVDDASTDDSCKLIEQFLLQDPRISIIAHEKNLGTFMVRKNGARAAHGQYIMYVDSDDYLSPDACARAYEVISLGYDIVTFCVGILPHGYVPPERLRNTALRYQQARMGEYNKREMIDAIFNTRDIFWQIAGKIYSRNIVLNALDELPDAHLFYAEDVYLLLAIVYHSRKMYKINDTLYIYRYGSGISVLPDSARTVKYTLNMGTSIKVIGEYAKSHNLDIGFSRINRDHCQQAISEWLTNIPDACLKKCLATFHAQYGFECVLQTFLGSFSHKKKAVADKLRLCIDKSREIPRNFRTVGIIVNGQLSRSETAILVNLADLLTKHNLRPIIIANTAQESVHIPDIIYEIIYLPTSRLDYDSDWHHLSSFYNSLKEFKIDIILSMDAYSPMNLWYIICCTYLAIPFYIIEQVGLSLPFMNNGLENAGVYEASFRCANLVLAASPQAEMFFCMRGCKCLYIDANVESRVNYDLPPYNSTLVSFIDNTISNDELYDLIKIIQIVRDDLPFIKLVLTGKNISLGTWNRLEGIIESEMLSDTIILKAHAEDTQLDLPPAVLGIFAITQAKNIGLISEALIKGLPCVAYAAPELGRLGPAGIFLVEPRNFQAMAKSIIDLLNSSEAWQALIKSIPATLKVFSAQRFCELLLDSISGDEIKMPNTEMHGYDYAALLDYAARYADL